MNKLAAIRLTINNQSSNHAFAACKDLVDRVIMVRELFSGTNYHGNGRTWKGETGTGRTVEVSYFEGRMTLTLDQSGTPGYQFAWQILSQVAEAYKDQPALLDDVWFSLELIQVGDPIPLKMGLAEAITALETEIDRQAQEDLLDLKARVEADRLAEAMADKILVDEAVEKAISSLRRESGV